LQKTGQSSRSRLSEKIFIGITPDWRITCFFVDNSKLASSAVSVTSNSTAYFIYFTFTFHSPVKIDIQLTSPAPEPTPNAPPIFGLDPTLFYEIVGALVAVVIIVVSAVLVTRRRGRSRPTT
jgi:hypothetical protein